MLFVHRKRRKLRSAALAVAILGSLSQLVFIDAIARSASAQHL